VDTKRRQTRTRGFTMIELMIVVAIIGIIAAIAVPNFIKFQARSKQSEAKANLKAMFTAEKAFYQERDRYSSLIGELPFAPERNNRYAYFFVAASPRLDDRTGTVATTAVDANGISVDTFKYGAASAVTSWSDPCGVTPGIVDPPSATFVGGAIGNVDADATKDVWSIATFSRTFPTASGCSADPNNPSGEPANDRNDVEQ
jgi:type IV pilus assembly protein PilA